MAVDCYLGHCKALQYSVRQVVAEALEDETPGQSAQPLGPLPHELLWRLEGTLAQFRFAAEPAFVVLIQLQSCQQRLVFGHDCMAIRDVLRR